MKKNILKKLFAGLLAATMAIPMFVAPASAEVEPGTGAVAKSFSIDFEDENEKVAAGSTSFAIGDFMGKAEVNTFAVETVKEINGNTYLAITTEAAQSADAAYNIWPDDMSADYTLTFDFMVTTEYYNYVSLQYRYDATIVTASQSNQKYIHDYGTKLNVNGTTKDGETFGLNKWWTYQVIRDDKTVTITVTERDVEIGMEPTVYTVSSTVSGNASVPKMRIMTGKNTSNETNTWAIDNVTYTANDAVAENDIVNNYIAEDFQGFSLGNAGITAGANTSEADPAAIGDNLMAYMKNSDYTATIEEEGNNKYFHYAADGKNNFFLYPANFETNTYTITGDFRWGFDTVNDSTDYVGIVFNTTALYRSNDNAIQTRRRINENTSEGFYVGGAKYFPAFDDGLAVYSAYDTNGNYTSPLDTWSSFKIVRSGTTVKIYFWKKGEACPTTPLKTLTVSNTFAGTPSIELMGAAVGSYVDLDNLTFSKDVDKVTTIGGQKTNVTDGTYAVRFVGVLNNITNVDKVGFQVKATCNDGTVMYFKLQDNKVYTSMITNDENTGVTEYSAQALGGNYLFAIGIHGIPDDYTNIKFDIKAVCYNANGTVIAEANTVDCYTVVEDTTVTLYDELAA